MSATPNELRVGGRTMSLETARTWVVDYFDPAHNIVSTTPYAYPAYDRLVTGSGPDELNDGDLLAPAMLNTTPKVRTFYRLQSLRDELVKGLVRTRADVTVHQAIADDSLDERLAAFVGVLDEHRPWGVKLTLLSKILHRKRPQLLPLHDRNINGCYVGGDGYPLHRDRNRSWVGYYAAVTRSIAADISDQAEAWTVLADHVPDDVTPLRLLDTVAWQLGRRTGSVRRA